MRRPKEKDCIGPSSEEVALCAPSGKVASPPDRSVRRCLRESQVGAEAADRRWTDTKWILNSDNAPADDHFLTTHQYFFVEPGDCPKPGARRARLLWHYLLHRHALRVGQEEVAPPEIEPYVTEYTEAFVKDFRPKLEAELAVPDEPPSEVDARHPLYAEAACSYWYQKQMLACTTRNGSHDRLQPFRRNSLFSTPVQQSLCGPAGPPRRVDHAVDAPYNTPSCDLPGQTE